jgi:glycosyltransferase involved in cell wall biosynthesis
LGAAKKQKMKIVIASILKPADDVRGFQKMAMTLTAEGHDVYLIGMPTTTPVTPPNIRFMELVPFHRLSWRRALAPVRVMKKIRQVKPQLLIVNTHELLLVGLLNRILFGTRIVYDIQENYYRNILWTRVFSPWVRRLIASWVRMKEWLLIPFFHRVIFAEKCYAEELAFAVSKAVTIENKAVLPNGFIRRPGNEKLLLAFTGTLSESTGVFEAIEFADRMYERRADLELHIIGSCAATGTLAEIMSRCSGKRYIKLVAGKMHVGHEHIMDLIARANFGIISYPPSPHTANRTPTKLFEYMSARLPILLRDNPRWRDLAGSVSAAIMVDFRNPTLEKILADMNRGNFYTGPVDDFLWASEKQKLIDLVNFFRPI